MYRLPIWCLCRLSAMSRWAAFSNKTKASPFRRPWLLRHKATPPLKYESLHLKRKFHRSSKHLKCNNVFFWIIIWKELHTLRHWGLQRILQCPGLKLAKVVLLPSHSNECLLYRFVSVFLAQVWFEPHPVHEILLLKIWIIRIAIFTLIIVTV